MKKLSLKNLKVMKLTDEEKKAVKGGTEPIKWETSDQCNRLSGPFIAWCNVDPGNGW